MGPDDAITVHLGRTRPYAIRWTNRAEARNASLPRPVAFNQLASGKRRLYVLCALIWSALVEREHGFEAPEDLADHLQTEDQQVAALKAVSAMVAQAFPEKKSPPSSAASAPGPKESSAPESVLPASTGGG